VKNMNLHFSSTEIAISAAIIAFLFLFFSPVVSGDGFGYYAILEGVGKDHTLNLENQMRFNEAGGAPFLVFNETTGKYVSKYPPGPAIFSLPLYFVSVQLERFSLFHIADEFFLREKQALLINQLALTVTALLFVFIALFLSFRAAEKWGRKNACLALLIVFFGTPMLWYSSADLAYSHVFEAALMAVLLYTIFVKSDSRLQGFSLGLLVLTRYTLALFALPLAVFYAAKRRFSDLAKIVLFAAPFAIFLMLYFQLQFGSPFSAGYHAGFDSFLPVHLLEMLFDLNRGILWWTPVVVAGIAGLFFLKPSQKWLLLSFVGINFWVYSAWESWHSAWSFGNRFLVVLFPVFVVGIAALLSRNPRLRPLLLLLALYTFLLSLLFIAATTAIPDPFNLSSLFSYWLGDGRLLELPLRVLEKTSVARAISLL